MAAASHTVSKSGRCVKSHNYAHLDEYAFSDHELSHSREHIPDSLLSYPEEGEGDFNTSYHQLLNDIDLLGLGTSDNFNQQPAKQYTDSRHINRHKPRSEADQHNLLRREVSPQPSGHAPHAVPDRYTIHHPARDHCDPLADLPANDHTSGYPPLQDDLDLELERLKLRKLNVQVSLARIDKQRQIRALQQDIASLESQFSTYTSKAQRDTMPSKSGTHSTPGVQTDPVTIDSLRNDHVLQSRTNRVMDSVHFTNHSKSAQKPGLAQPFRHDHDSGSGQYPVYDDDKPLGVHDRIRSRSKCKSGKSVLCSDEVINRQIWPQSKLSMQYVSQKIPYEELTPLLFVAGYLQDIIDNHAVSEIAFSKLEHLVNLMYTGSSYQWETVLDTHAAVLNSIENGKRSWGDSFLDIETRIIQTSKPRPSNRTRSNTSSKSKNRPFSVPMFCRPFQTGKCSVQTSSHSAVVRGNAVTVNHICATCALAEGVRRDHPETSPDCKYSGRAEESRSKSQPS